MTCVDSAIRNEDQCQRSPCSPTAFINYIIENSRRYTQREWMCAAHFEVRFCSCNSSTLSLRTSAKQLNTLLIN